jgi:hypothetical protein
MDMGIESGDIETLSAEEGEWGQVGAELRRVDPLRYVELLRLAMRIVAAHRDPAERLISQALHLVPRGRGSA